MKEKFNEVKKIKLKYYCKGGIICRKTGQSIHMKWWYKETESIYQLIMKHKKDYTKRISNLLKNLIPFLEFISLLTFKN